jgi:hypothetical protein
VLVDVLEAVAAAPEVAGDREELAARLMVRGSASMSVGLTLDLVVELADLLAQGGRRR